MEDLIKKLVDEGYLKSTRIINAFKKIKRHDFLPPDIKTDAHLNIPLPLSHGQTISQPLTVAFMLELLQPKKGEKVLDIGSGSGWQTTMLAELVGPEGKVYAIERIPPLKEFGQQNLNKYGYQNVEFICGDGTRGYKKAAPYDKIIVAAAAEIGIPDILLKQLKVGGRLVIPVGKYEQAMVMMDKVTDNDFHEKRFPGFQFVPLIPRKWGE
ncbi:protein-L-isoaspartate(D-aspartate) O-methyltransferase [Patescibacteria group bacterium]|nr:protein-L-isoaspartate(D-aspartate) O-methyltransferase [Patescibacteria group bacterium]MBU0963767.1 protein-L-isoaspartate(D-aspartate) O-methyltransferase [Patescibacteria group bacterium]